MTNRNSSFKLLKNARLIACQRKESSLTSAQIKTFRESAKLLKLIPKSKVKKEIEAGFNCPRYFYVLDKLGFLEILFPEVTDLRNFYTKSGKTQLLHTIRTVNNIPNEITLMKWSALFHDIGKVNPLVDHSILGKEIALKIMRRYNFTTEEKRYISKMILHHKLLAKVIKKNNQSNDIEKILKEDSKFLKDLVIFTRADVKAHRHSKSKRQHRLKGLNELRIIINKNAKKIGEYKWYAKWSKSDLIDYYTRENCPYFAIAFQELYGNEMGVIVDYGRKDNYGRKDYPIYAHIFIYDKNNPELIIDIKGKRHISKMKNYYYDLKKPTIETISKREILNLMGRFKPFYSFDPEEVNRAKVLIKDRYSDLK